MGAEHPGGIGLALALAIGGQEIAEGVGGELDMRDIEEDLLNLRAHMILVKGRGGLIQELLEDRGQRVGHGATVPAVRPLPNAT